MDAPAKAAELIEFVEGEMPDDATERFIACRRIALHFKRYLPTSIAAVTTPAAMTDAEAKQFGKQHIAFGKYAGKAYDEVDLSYLVWLSDASHETWKDLTGYLRSPRIKAELESDDAD